MNWCSLWLCAECLATVTTTGATLLHACVCNSTGAANRLAEKLAEMAPTLLLAKDFTGRSVLATAAERAIHPELIEWLIGKIGKDAQQEDVAAARAAVMNHHGVVQCAIKAYSCEDQLRPPKEHGPTSAQV